MWKRQPGSDKVEATTWKRQSGSAGQPGSDKVEATTWKRQRVTPSGCRIVLQHLKSKNYD